MTVVVAAFDVDHTLTVRDCVVPFMVKVARPLGFVKIVTTGSLEIARIAIRRDRDAMKSFFVDKVFAGRTVDDVEQMGIEFASRIVGSWMRADVAQRLRWHQAQGHVVVLVSASLSPYLHTFGDLCEVDAVLCTELDVHDGVYTGKIDGVNCRGEEKVNRLKAWLDSSGIPHDAVEFAYGDSSGDVALLEFAHNGYLVKAADNVEELV